MHTSLLEVQFLPIKSLAFNVQVTRMQEHVKIQAVQNWNNPLLNWLSCLLCLHRLHCLLGGFSCCLHRLLCHDVECLENRVTLLRLQISPWANATRRVGLSTCGYLLQYFFKHTLHSAYTWTWAAVRAAPMGYLVPGRVWHGAWATLLHNINTWNLCRRFAAHIGFIFHPFPAVLAMLDPAVFPQTCSTQSVKVIR